MNETKPYKVLVICQNCGVLKRIEIPYGTTRLTYPCPNCGIAGQLVLATPSGKPK